MIHNSHLVHPEIWMLWFSFFVACGVVLWAVAGFALWVERKAAPKGGK